MKPSPFEDIAHLQLAAEADVLSWWRSQHRTKWIAKAARSIGDLYKEGGKLLSVINQQKKEITRLGKAETVAGRILAALGELERNKGNRDPEDPYCVVLSPFQFEKITLGGGKMAQYAGLLVITAKGVSGPVVMTETAFMAFSRNAPELNIQLRS